MMKPFSRALFAFALLALPLWVIAAPRAVAAQASPGAATISNPGGHEFSGFMIVVEPGGRAWSLDGAGHSDGQLQIALAQALFADLAAAGPLATLPERACDDAILIGWNGQRSSNLKCSSDPRAMRLLADVVAIQRALYVQSYRMPGAVASDSTVGGYAAPSSGGTTASVARSGGGYAGRSAAANASYAAPAGRYGASYTGGAVNTPYVSIYSPNGQTFNPSGSSALSFHGQFSTNTISSGTFGRVNGGGPTSASNGVTLSQSTRFGGTSFRGNFQNTTFINSSLTSAPVSSSANSGGNFSTSFNTGGNGFQGSGLSSH